MSSPNATRRGQRGALFALVGALLIAVAALVTIPIVSGGGGTAHHASAHGDQNELQTLAERTLAEGALAYQQSRSAGDPAWRTEAEIIDGTDAALFELPSTYTLAGGDDVLVPATSGRPQEVLIGCTDYIEQPDGTYWKTRGVRPAFGPQMALSFGGRLRTRIIASRTGGITTYSTTVRSRSGRGGTGTASTTMHVTVEHGRISKVVWTSSGGTGVNAGRSHWSQTLVGSYGMAHVEAPPPREVSKVVTARSSTACARR